MVAVLVVVGVVLFMVVTLGFAHKKTKGKHHPEWETYTHKDTPASKHDPYDDGPLTNKIYGRVDGFDVTANFASVAQQGRVRPYNMVSTSNGTWEPPDSVKNNPAIWNAEAESETDSSETKDA